jgi:hypothetical protein
MNANQIFDALVIAATIWLGRSMLAFAKEMTEWRIELFGKDGRSGMRGEVHQLRTDVDGLMGKTFTRRASDIT